MKLAYAGKAGGRNMMREKQRRDRLATPLLRTVYPQFASLRLVFEFRDSGPFTPTQQVNVLHPPAKAYFAFPCPYADCDGEFDLTTSIAELAREESAHLDGKIHCSGQRHRDNNGRSPCGLTLEFRIEAQRE